MVNICVKAENKKVIF